MLGSKQCLAGALALATAGLAHGITVTNIGTTGVFDAIATPNQIDNDPTGTLAAFTAAVATAYANDLGGVIDWTTGAGALANSSTSPNNFIGTPMTAAYGVNATNSLTITPDRAVGIYTNNVSNQVSALTGTTAIVADGGNLAIGLAIGLAFSGANVTEIGFGALSRTTYGANGVDFRATVTYSDASTQFIDYTLGNIAGGSDTFLHFAATGGKTISSLLVEYIDDNGGNLLNGQRRPALDDLGFITVVPEPGSLALLGLGGLLVARRRRA